ncbi:MAG TPA: hypothetical protein VM578_06400 [Candidatus Saccharimonadales bacterium]|nr:hypothetical protein [Candidatus Saccharimonadales bacterium]
MSEAFPDGIRRLPEPDARPPVAPSAAPAFPDPSEQPLPISGIEAEETAPPFTLESEGRKGMTGTAERIGTAVGTAQRQMRRGLELVRRPTGTQIAAVTMDAEQRATQLAHIGMDRATQIMEDIGEEVSDAGRQAARRLDKWSKEAGERFQQFRLRARRTLTNSRTRAQELGDAYPLHTIAATAGFCFALGVALRMRRSRRG